MKIHLAGVSDKPVPNSMVITNCKRQLKVIPLSHFPIEAPRVCEECLKNHANQPDHLAVYALAENNQNRLAETNLAEIRRELDALNTPN